MQHADARTFSFAGFRLDLQQGTLGNQNGEIELRPKSFEVLRYLVGNAGRLVAKEELLQAVWPNVTASEESLTRCISDVRLALQDGESRIIKTVPRRGYRFTAPVTVSDTPAARVANAAAFLSNPKGPSIAVLPFANMSDDPEQDYFADGVVEEITIALSRFKWLFVISRNSSFTYKNKAVDIKQVGRELGVRYVLEGSVRKNAEQARITGQLIDAETGIHLWADRFEGSLRDIFSLQDEMTLNVVTAIEPRMWKTEIELAVRRRPNDLKAYDMYLRAFPHFYSMTREGIAAALRLFSGALEFDALFGSAALMACECHNANISFGWTADPKSENEEAWRLARLALSIDDSDPEILATAGRMTAYLAGESEAAMVLADRAVALNPNSSVVWLHRGWTCIYAEQPNEALRSFERAIHLSPLDPALYLMLAGMAFAYISLNRFEDAIFASRRALRQNDKFTPAFRSLAAALAHLGREEEARDAAGHVLKLEPGFRISEWLSRSHSYSPNHFIDGLRKAGLPE
jgi:TolB-like protein